MRLVHPFNNVSLTWPTLISTGTQLTVTSTTLLPRMSSCTFHFFAIEISKYHHPITFMLDASYAHCDPLTSGVKATSLDVSHFHHRAIPFHLL